VAISDIESLHVPIVLGLAAIALGWITVTAIAALRKGNGFGTTLKAWARGLVEIISNLG